MYLYKTILYKDTVDVTGIDNAQNDLDKNDFESNHKANAVKVDELLIEETTFVINKSYTDFSALIDGTVYTWADVRFIENEHEYHLHLCTSEMI